MARTRKEGSLIKRGSRYYLQINIDKHRTIRVIRNPENHAAATTTEEAERWRDSTAEQIRQDVAGHRKESLPISELIEAYKEFLPIYSKRRGSRHVDSTKESRLAPNTRRINERTLRQLVSFISKNYSRLSEAQDIQSVHVEAFMASKAEYKDGSYNRFLASLKHVFEVIPHLDSAAIKNLRGRSRADVEADTLHKGRFTDEELLAMQEKATGWIRPAMFIGFYTGLRLGDILTLKWEDISQDGFIHQVTRKTGKVFEAYAPAVVIEIESWRNRSILEWNNAVSMAWLGRIWKVSKATAWSIVKEAGGLLDPSSESEYLQWINDTMQKAVLAGFQGPGLRKRFNKLPLQPIPDSLSQYVFPKRAEQYLGIGNRKTDQVAATKMFQRFLKNCGIETQGEQKGQATLGFHSLRVTYATYHRIRSGDISSTQKQLQHSSSRTTEIYDRRSSEEVRTELKANYIPLPFPGQKALPLSDQEQEPERQELHQKANDLPLEVIREVLELIPGIRKRIGA